MSSIGYVFIAIVCSFVAIFGSKNVKKEER